MAIESKRVYLDVNAEDFSTTVQELIKAQRDTYMADKAARKALVEAMRREVPVQAGQEIAGVHYTRWGQMQMSIGDKVAPKSAAKARPTLADWLAQQAALGQSS